jgi:hypothetical protein
LDQSAKHWASASDPVQASSDLPSSIRSSREVGSSRIPWLHFNYLPAGKPVGASACGLLTNIGPTAATIKESVFIHSISVCSLSSILLRKSQAPCIFRPRVLSSQIQASPCGSETHR